MWYVGEFQEALQHGTGTCNYGDVYKGEWNAGKRRGKGEMTYTNKDIYASQWNEDLKDVQGVMKFHNCDIYEGEFSHEI